MGVAVMAGRMKTNLAIASGAVLLWTLMVLVTGRIDVHEGLGFEDEGFAGMVRGFTLKGGDEPTRLSPLYPALAWLPYAVTGDVARSLTIVDGAAMVVLVIGACLLIDDRRKDSLVHWRKDALVKVFVGFTLALLIAFGKLAAFVPGQPELCALATLMLAVALASPTRPLVTAAAHVAAVMAMPVGLVAPLYGVVHMARTRVPSARIPLVVAPAVLMWVFVQWWARGGVAGAISDFTPRAILGSIDVWVQPLFLVFALYFLATVGGGLSLIAFARPSAWSRMTRRSPEALVLCAAVMAYAVVSGSAAPLAFGFLAPVWVLLCVEWTEFTEPRRLYWWLAAGVALTLITQRPLAQVDLTSYFVDWHPYDVYRGSAPLQYQQFWERWVPRFLVAATSLWLMAIVGAIRPARNDERGEIDAAAIEPPHDPRPAIVPLLLERTLLEWTRTLARTVIVVRTSRRWPTAAYAYALILGALTAYFLLGIPIQLTDSFGNLLGIQGMSLWDVFREQMGSAGYLRPLLQVQLKVVYDLSHGEYFAWYRSVQALQVAAVLFLSVRLLRPVHATDMVVLPCCLAIVLGLHTFAGAIREGFPINTFLTLVLCCLAAANLAQSRGGWLVEASSALLLGFSLLTLETGILVWVIFVAAYVVGYRGVSRRCVAIATVILAGYFILRFGVLGTGAPGLNERASGFGFRVLEPAELVVRFGAHPLPLYLYNYVCAVLTVLFAEPRGGVWWFVAGISRGPVEPWDAINVVTSTLTTGAIALYVARHARAWRRWELDDADRLVLLFLAVLPANALFCVVYVKDVIMSPAGVFYALASFAALRELIVVTPRMRRGAAPAWTVIMLVLISAGWGWRLLGIHYSLRVTAANVRSEWAFEDEWETTSRIRISSTEAVALKRTLLDDAIWRRPAPPHLDVGWADHAFDKTQ
jgi:hypothetical protein